MTGPKIIGDVLDRLKKLNDRRAGTADSDVNALTIPISVPCGTLSDAISEIEQLRNRIMDLEGDQHD